ncbi:hypothetical protein D917_03211 [Trichinella nativa]|uniref:Transmembrane protein n=3 Tax=Trichinella TaxID=6333 RepID=A0A1Y3E957_9BILA|nr:hypothetical protein T01_11414 [Trichinella spiralis]OUC41653.1 hypothetical protein D917_03211 [Trichinella nativa]
MEDVGAGFVFPSNVIMLIAVSVSLLLTLSCLICRKANRPSQIPSNQPSKSIDVFDQCSSVELKHYRKVYDSSQLPEIKIENRNENSSTSKSPETLIRIRHDSFAHELEAMQRTLADSDHDANSSSSKLTVTYANDILDCDLALAIASDLTSRNSVFLSRLTKSPVSNRAHNNDIIMSPSLLPAMLHDDVRILGKERTPV